MSERIVFKSGYLFSENGRSEKYRKISYEFEGLPDSGSILQYREIKPGFSIASFSIAPGFLSGYDFEIENSPVEFTYCLRGKSSLNFKKTGSGNSREIKSKAGMNIISNASSVSGEFRIEDTDNFRVIALHIDPELLSVFLHPYMDSLPPEIKMLFTKSRNDFVLPLFMNPQMERVTQEITNSPYTGASGELYLESKALELMAVQIDSLVNHEKGVLQSCITPKDIDRIYEARNILTGLMESPPGISKLARLAGINEFKLKKGFKEVFGITVFGYLKKYRMDYARKMILEGGANVSEIAYSVGYSNVSHFIAAYKNEFGFTPGEYIRKNFRKVA